MVVMSLRISESEEPVADQGSLRLRWLTQNRLFDVQWLPADIEGSSSGLAFWNDIFASRSTCLGLRAREPRVREPQARGAVGANTRSVNEAAGANKSSILKYFAENEGDKKRGFSP